MMKPMIGIALWLSAATLIAVSPLKAQTVGGSQAVAPVVEVQAGLACAPRARVIDQLEARFQERRRGLGLAGLGARRDRGAGDVDSPRDGLATAVVELWASEKTGTWTVLMTGPDGRACIIASGQDWQSDPPNLAALGDPA